MRRQRHDWDRAALDALRDGDVETWAGAYREQGRIVARPTSDATRTQLVSDWWRAAQQPDIDAVMIAHRRVDIADLNARARALLRATGQLGDVELEAGGRGFAAGDRVVASRNDRRLGVVNGDRGEVVAVDLDRRTAQLRLSGGATVNLDATYLDEGHLDHGYALTAHKAQGATVDRAFVLGSDQLSREWGYTVSRHREEARFYLVSPASVERNLPTVKPDDPLTERLVEMLGDSHAKTLALDHVAVEEPGAAETRSRDSGCCWRTSIVPRASCSAPATTSRTRVSGSRGRRTSALPSDGSSTATSAPPSTVTSPAMSGRSRTGRSTSNVARSGSAPRSRIARHGSPSTAKRRSRCCALSEPRASRSATRFVMSWPRPRRTRHLSSVAERDDLVRDALAPQPEPLDVSLSAPEIDIGPDLGP